MSLGLDPTHEPNGLNQISRAASMDTRSVCAMVYRSLNRQVVCLIKKNRAAPAADVSEDVTNSGTTVAEADSAQFGYSSAVS